MFYNCCGLKSKNLTCYSTYLKPAVDESGRYRFSFIYNKTLRLRTKSWVPATPALDNGLGWNNGSPESQCGKYPCCTLSGDHAGTYLRLFKKLF